MTNRSRSALPVIAAALLLAGCERTKEQAAEEDDGPLFAAPSFDLVDQDGRPFSSQQLLGRTWVATLFFTTCPGPCPMMSKRLQKIQAAVPDKNLMLVSLSVDPDHDTPESLKDYARNMSADPARWVFLTGTPDAVQKTADGLKLGYAPAPPGGEITHSTKFLLIDKTGQVRGIYSTSDDDSMKKLEQDAKKLIG